MKDIKQHIYDQLYVLEGHSDNCVEGKTEGFLKVETNDDEPCATAIVTGVKIIGWILQM